MQSSTLALTSGYKRGYLFHRTLYHTTIHSTPTTSISFSYVMFPPPPIEASSSFIKASNPPDLSTASTSSTSGRYGCSPSLMPPSCYVFSFLPSPLQQFCHPISSYMMMEARRCFSSEDRRSVPTAGCQ